MNRAVSAFLVPSETLELIGFPQPRLDVGEDQPVGDVDHDHDQETAANSMSVA